MSQKVIQFSIDLVEAALKHRQFLQLVDEHPSLCAGPHVQNAIRRCVYSKFGKQFKFQVQSLYIFKVRTRFFFICKHVLLRSNCNPILSCFN